MEEQGCTKYNQKDEEYYELAYKMGRTSKAYRGGLKDNPFYPDHWYGISWIAGWESA